jgi:hypothetical protein
MCAREAKAKVMFVKRKYIKGNSTRRRRYEGREGE